MELTWIETLLKLLNLGPVGTLFVVVASYLAWQLKLEQEEHKETRETLGELNEKRLALHAENLQTLAELKHSLDELTKEVRRRR